jgi:hypothetical protein
LSLFRLLHQPRMMDDDEFGTIGKMIERWNWSTRRKPAPVPLYPPQIPYDLPRARTRAFLVRSQRLIAWATARLENITLSTMRSLDSDYEGSSDGQNICTHRGTVRFMCTRTACHSWHLLYEGLLEEPSLVTSVQSVYLYIYLSLLVWALAGHLQAQHKNILKSYLSHNGSVVFLLQVLFVYDSGKYCRRLPKRDCEASKHGFNHLVVKLNLKMLKYGC